MSTQFTPSPMNFNRLGPATMPQMQVAANHNTFMNSPYNFQAQMLGAGNPGQGMYGFSQYLNTSPMMQRFLPEVTRHAMNQPNPFPVQYQYPWTLNGQTATFNPNLFNQQQQPGLPPPNQPPPNVRDARQAFRSTLTPEQIALQGGDMGNKDFRQSLSPQQEQLRLAFQQLKQNSGGAMPPQGMPPQGTPPQQAPSAMSAYQGNPSPIPQNMAQMMRQAPPMPSRMQGMPQLPGGTQSGMPNINPQMLAQMFQRMGMNLGMGY